MIKQEMTDSIRHYLEGLPDPDIDTGIVLEGFSLLHLHREIEMLTEIFISRLGLSARQTETLEALFHHPERTLTPAQLADEVHLTRSAMTSNLDSLERKGYVSRAMHPVDRRMISVTLTEKGIMFCEERMPVRYRDMARVISIFSADERRMVYATYNKLVQFLKEILKEDTVDLAKTSQSKA